MKAKHLLKGIQVGFFDTAKYWGPDTYDEYYLYFNHPDSETRKYALLVFGAALGNTHMQSATVFSTLKQQQKDLSYTPNKVNILENYVRSFIDNSDSIKHEFPYLYKLIIYYFINLNITVGDDVHQISQDTFDKLKAITQSSGVSSIYRNKHFNFNKILEETGLSAAH